MEKPLISSFVGFVNERSIHCELGENENDSIRDRVIDKCYSSKLREGALTLDDLLRIERSQEPADRQLK